MKNSPSSSVALSNLEDPLAATRRGDWSKRWIGIFLRSLWRILTAYAIVIAFPLLINAILMILLVVIDPGFPVRPTFPPLMTTAAYVSDACFSASILTLPAIATCVTVCDAAHVKMPVGRAVRIGARRSLPWLGWHVVATALTAVGLVALLVPGVYIGVTLGTTLTCVVTVEKKGIRRCLELTRGRWRLTLRRFLDTVAIATVATLAAVYWGAFPILREFAVQLDSLHLGTIAAVLCMSAVAFTLYSLIGVVALAATTAMAVVNYAELRRHQNPAITARSLACELTATP